MYNTTWVLVHKLKYQLSYKLDELNETFEVISTDFLIKAAKRV